MRTPANTVIQAWGSVRGVETATGIPASNVQRWKRTGLVPSEVQGTVLRAAERDGKAITAADLIYTGRVKRRKRGGHLNGRKNGSGT